MTEIEYAAATEHREAESVRVLSKVMPEDLAVERVRRGTARFLPDGLDTADHYLLTAENEAGEAVGNTWIGPDPSNASAAWVYDLNVFTPFRRRGYGTAILTAAEAFRRRRGPNGVGPERRRRQRGSDRAVSRSRVRRDVHVHAEEDPGDDVTGLETAMSTNEHDPITRDLMHTFEDIRSRTFARLEGMTDAEYLWQPVPDCVTVRAHSDGVVRADPCPPDSADPSPFTTIAWRMWHIGADCLRHYRAFFEDTDLTDVNVWPGTADEAVQALADDWANFESRLAALGDKRLLEPMGPRAKAFAEKTYLQLALFALDEAAHHAAELGVLRDLYVHGFKTAA
ncbi:GNAT family N-acetyltransferase [Actinospica robiniae]|uniref:GNAT family N-acetyltransferase n=1 Tax=Actinospica robiniae TaxID=304901 RepID=UPI001FE0DFC0|nr:GNAT family N-acetyltransferase [Actinospica robiniae]